MTLADRISENSINLTNFNKHDAQPGEITGKGLLVNKIPNLCVIDIDVNKKLSDEVKQQIRNDIVSKLSADDIVVRTGSGGLHIYANVDDFQATSNRMIKCYSCEQFDIDIMTSFDESKRSLIVLPESRVKVDRELSSYEFIQGSYDSVITRSVTDILSDLGIKIPVKQSSKQIPVKQSSSSKPTSKPTKFEQLLVNGLVDLDVHNDSGDRTIRDEVTLFPLFQAINSLSTPDLRDEAYNNVLTRCKLTQNARSNFERSRKRYIANSTSIYILAKIIKYHRKDYYDEFLRKYVLNNRFALHEIELNNSFDLNVIRSRAEKREYSFSSEVAEDLSKVIRKIDDGSDSWVMKAFDTFTDTYKLVFVKDEFVMKELKRIVYKITDKNKAKTAKDVVNKYLSKFVKQGVKFNARVNKENVLSLFHGYKYQLLEQVNLDLINMFLTFIREVICDNNTDVYNYVIGWIATMIQNPGIKNETALVLKGLQGIGKNRFTDILSELLSGYSAKNVTEISELTGTFNSIVEGRMLIVLNELKNCGEERLANFDALKSIITDDCIRINEKNQPRRTAENVASFIFCTNHSFPVKIESGDRRYVVLNVNAKYKGNFKYFKQLMDSCTSDFYDNLLTYFSTYDLSEFNVREIPMTEAKQDIIAASRSPIDLFIMKHYNELVSEKGMSCSYALRMKPDEVKTHNFQLIMKDKCNRVRPRDESGTRYYSYVLKPEYRELYKSSEEDVEDVYEIE